MRWIVVSLGILFFSEELLAKTSLRFFEERIQTPVDRNLVHLILEGRDLVPGNVSIKFNDSNSMEVEAYSVRIKNSEVDSCGNQDCSLDIFKMPPHLEKYSCKVLIEYRSLSNHLIFNTTLKWGHCERMKPSPDIKFLPDLKIRSEGEILESGNIWIMNQGSSFFNKNIEAFGVIRNKDKKIIWSGRSFGSLSLENSGVLMINLGKEVKEWQKREGCYAEIYIDSQYEIFEKDKKNNAVEFDYGYCERTPREEDGDLADFIPFIRHESGNVSVGVENAGTLPFFPNHGRLSIQLSYYNQEKKLIFMKDVFLDSPLYGHGDSSVLTNEPFAEGSCSLEVIVNPNSFFKEENYYNNIKILNLCGF